VNFLGIDSRMTQTDQSPQNLGRCTILIGYPYNKRSNVIETSIEYIGRHIGRVVFLSPEATGPLEKWLESHKIEYYFLSAQRLRLRNVRILIRYIVKVRCLIKKIQPQKIIAHQQLTLLTLRCATIFMPIDVYYVRHNTDEDRRVYGVKSALLNALCNICSQKKIAPTQHTRAYWSQELFAKHSKIAVVPYLYKFSKYDHLASLDPSQLAVPSVLKQFLVDLSGVVIVSLSRLTYTKRVDQLIELVAELMARGVYTKLINFGEGEDLARLEKLRKKYKLDSHICFSPFIDNPYPFLKRASFYVSMSESESSNSAVKEAGYLGIPVVVKGGVGDFDEYLQGDTNAIVLRSNQPVAEAATRIVEMLVDSARLESMSRNLKRTLLERFSSERLSTTYDFLIDD